jgi:hypothetical protein
MLINFQNDEDNVVSGSTIQKDWVVTEYIWLRVRVLNNGHRIAKTCQVYLTSLYKVRADGIALSVRELQFYPLVVPSCMCKMVLASLHLAGQASQVVAARSFRVAALITHESEWPAEQRAASSSSCALEYSSAQQRCRLRPPSADQLRRADKCESHPSHR